jgi:hypothetical protein
MPRVATIGDQMLGGTWRGRRSASGGTGGGTAGGDGTRALPRNWQIGQKSVVGGKGSGSDEETDGTPPPQSAPNS